MNALKLISNSGLHDYRVISLNIDNDNAVIEIALTDPHQKRVIITMERFTELRISHREPWGKGTYIVASDIQQMKDVTLIILELNSGDDINIASSGSITVYPDLI